MTKIIAVLFMAIALVGCSNDSDNPNNNPSEPQSDRSPVYGPKLSDEAYADFVRDNVVGVRNVDDETLVENALLTCDALESGATLKDLYSAGMASGVSPSTAGGLVGAAISWDCPEYTYMID